MHAGEPSSTSAVETVASVRSTATTGEPTLLSLAAQLESARPWPLVAPPG